MDQPPPMPPAFPRPEGVVTWGGSIVSVRGRVIPKYLWTTTSIDVYLDEQCILRTGGKLDPGGASSATFDRGGVNHSVKLSWGATFGFAFPYLLYIDGALVASSRVRADNWYMTLIVRVILWAVLGLMIFHFFHRFFHGISQ